MSVILVILKILGIILLTVIGILLFLLFLLLMVPVGYRVEGHSENKWKIHGSVYWLFHAVSCHFVFDGEAFDIKFKLFGIQKKQKKRREHDTSGGGEADAVPAEDAEEEPAKYIPIETPDSAEQASDIPSSGDTILFVATEEPHIRDRLQQEKKGAESVKPDRKPKERRDSLLRKIRSAYSQVRDLFSNIREKWKGLREILSDEKNKKAFSCVWKELTYLLKHMRFRKMKTEVEFSAGDPALTGQALGILSMLPFLYLYQVHIYPDFEAEKVYVSGSFQVKGHFRLVHLLISAVRLLLHEECRRLLKRIMK